MFDHAYVQIMSTIPFTRPKAMQIKTRRTRLKGMHEFEPILQALASNINTSRHHPNPPVLAADSDAHHSNQDLYGPLYNALPASDRVDV